MVTTYCRHCLEERDLEIIGRINDFKTVENKKIGSYEQGNLYQLLECTTCEGLVFRKTFFIKPRDEGKTKDQITWDVIYPEEKSLFSRLPKSVKNEYLSARRVKNVDSNAYGAMLGRVLEAVCEDQGTTKAHLSKKLEELVNEDLVPEEIHKLAERLKELRNVGAHVDVGNLTEDEIPILEKITEAILEHLYSIPSLIKEADERLNKIEDENND